MRLHTALAAFGMFFLSGSLQAGTVLWWEAEKPVKTNFPSRSDFSPDTFPQARHLLSEGNWLSASGPRRGAGLFAKYTVEIATEATYDLWVRKFWNHGPFRWRFDDREWTDVGTNMPLADDVSLRTYVGANWVFLGTVKLPKGSHDYEIQLTAKSGENNTSGFDCFVLADGPFIPSGNRKPGEKSGRAEPGYFPYEPSIDNFSSDALLDLRALNENVAGESGFVKKADNDFALGSGKPVRFWGVNCSIDNIRQNPRSVDYLARRLAKAGVNLVRLHGKLWKDSNIERFDPQNQRDLHRFVQALKKQGIYVSLSFYFPLWFEAKDAQGLAGFDANQNKKPFAVLFFNPRMQALHRMWVKQLLETPGEDGSAALGQDPAVAFVELQNEDSLFFWTFNKKNIPPAQWQMMEDQFTQWMVEKYGSVAKALAAWGKSAGDKDDRADHLAMLEIFNLTGPALKNASAERVRRVGDQVHFMAELQRGFYDRSIAQARANGAQNLFTCSNWITADAPVLDAIERWTYTGGDFVESHGYFGGKHEGDGAGYSVRVGHRYEDLAAVLVPDRLPIRVFNTEGYPMRISEIGWTPPNRFRSDATLLASAYGSLQGLDALDWFIVGSNYLFDAPGRKFDVSGPSMLGTFPATALAFRQGLVKEGKDVIYAVVNPQDLFAMKGSVAASGQALDALRAADVPTGTPGEGAFNRFDPLAFYVGRVTRAFGDDAAKSRQMLLTDFIDRQKKVVRSLTGELGWDYGRGLVRVDAPSVQAAAGFLQQAGRIDLRDVGIESANEFGQIVVISLDGQPIAQSHKLLVQAMTEEKALGEKVEAGVIQSLGSPPPGVKLIDAKLTLRNWTGKVKVQPLDENGYASGESTQSPADSLQLPARALHCIVSR